VIVWIFSRDDYSFMGAVESTVLTVSLKLTLTLTLALTITLILTLTLILALTSQRK